MFPLCVDCVEKVQKTIKVPIRYLLMALTVVAVVLIKLFFPKELFYTTSVFVVALVSCVKSVSEQKGEEKKWCAFWIVFALSQFLPSCLYCLKYYAFIKFVALLYLALVDDCEFILELFNIAFNKMTCLYNTYVEKYCKKPEEKSD